MEITASMVRELREKSGAGMMQCKKALQSTRGDLEQAFDELRKAGLKTAAKKAGRATAEGRLTAGMTGDGRAGAMVALACETDFVAKTPDFEAFLSDLCAHVLEHAPADVEACLGQAWKGAPQTVGEALKGLIGKLGENILVDQVQAYRSPEGYVGFYVHHDQKKGALASVATAAGREAAEEFLRDLGMHIVSHDEILGMDRDSVPEELVEREREIIRDGLEGKPPEIQEKILSGRLDKFFAERVLSEQGWIKDDSNSTTVAQALTASLGEGARVLAFARFDVGQ